MKFEFESNAAEKQADHSYSVANESILLRYSVGRAGFRDPNGLPRAMLPYLDAVAFIFLPSR